MKHNFRSCLVINSLIFIIVALFTLPSYAENFETFIDIEKKLGIAFDGQYSNVVFDAIPINSTVEAKIVDPTKLGGCNIGDRVIFTKIENEKWRLTRVKSGEFLIFKIRNEDEQIKISKTGEYSQPLYEFKKKMTRTGYSFAIKGGIYEPTGDLDGFGTGFSGELSVSKYISSNFALESTIGYFQTEYNESGIVPGDAYSATIEGYAIPITLNVKAIQPLGFGEIYAGVGLGVYFIQGDLDVNFAESGSASADDNDVIYGAHILGGVSFDISDTTFFGVEGKYIFTSEADMGHSNLGSVKFDINGFTAMGVIGFRF